MAMQERDKLFEAIKREYGADVVILHKKHTDYYVTESALCPAESKKAVLELASRLAR